MKANELKITFQGRIAPQCLMSLIELITSIDWRIPDERINYLYFRLNTNESGVFQQVNELRIYEL